MTTFADFGLPTPAVNVLTRQGITTPFPIQTATLPDSLDGRDVLGRGRTGSGKTLAFSLPLVTRLDRAPTSRHPRRPRALVLCPTRELANQINATMEPVAKALGLVTTTIFGGVAQSRQVNALNAGVDVVIACPGRLEDLLNQKVLTLDGIEITVLDEADHMADLGFLPGVKRIMARTPKVGQRMLFSATLDNGVDQLVKLYLNNPVRHSVDDAASAPPKMTHHILAVRDADAKKEVVQQLASGTGRRILFMRTKHQAKKLAKQLTAAGIPAVDLHGNLGQNARERNLEAFSNGSVKVMVATDIAARGIHVDEIELVVHVDPPAEHKAYLHRSGRTARAGEEGVVVTVMLPEQRGDVRDLTRKARITAQPKPAAPGDETITGLVGDVAPYVKPEPIHNQVQQPRKPKAAGQGGSGRGQGGRSQGGSGRDGAGQGARSGSAGGSQGGSRRRSGGGRGQGGRSQGGQSPRGGTQLAWSSSTGGASHGPAGPSQSRADDAAQPRPRRGGRGRSSRGAGAPGGQSAR
ncbi:putative ATP-dependent RNA helicase [Paraoerskovia sediminicola]|uniref:ATP-dependent RNA helicase n=1 Tax=Paraoerskovia sediminicola TaxID=1138587 RepID=A0ABN6X9I0_9CELL|nr:DEAD/DEAH box helicase [Paraoerskovia sediminicola]BDZ41527.1 putative ATP-dependent RNA helicase [Paraoerskovia sediminicola]